jgi:hypothetical protein
MKNKLRKTHTIFRSVIPTFSGPDVVCVFMSSLRGFISFKRNHPKFLLKEQRYKISNGTGVSFTSNTET